MLPWPGKVFPCKPKFWETWKVWLQWSSRLSLLNLCVCTSLLLFYRRSIARTTEPLCGCHSLFCPVFGKQWQNHIIWSLGRQKIVRSCHVLKMLEHHYNEKGLWILPTGFTKARVLLCPWKVVLFPVWWWNMAACRVWWWSLACGVYQSWSHQETDGIFKIEAFLHKKTN